MADKREKSSRRRKKDSCNSAAEASAGTSAADSTVSSKSCLTEENDKGCMADPADERSSCAVAEVTQAQLTADAEQAVADTEQVATDATTEKQTDCSFGLPVPDAEAECASMQGSETGCTLDVNRKDSTESLSESETKNDVSSSGRHFTQHHVSRILDAVLEEGVPNGDPADVHARFRFPLVVDALLGIGLLIAVGGFTVGIVKMYVTHQAQQYILQQDYPRAIGLLSHSPLPPIFNVDGTEPDETLAQALWLDSLKKSEAGDTDGALAELEQIRPGSKYFDEAQRTLADNFEPSGTVLQCSVSQEAETSSR